MTQLTKKQKKTFRRDLIVNGEPVVIIATVRHDDSCGNGHNTFSVTADYYEKHAQRGEPTVKHESGATLWLNACGCLHDEVAKHFPELAPLLKWHLCSTDGPMHYIANTVHFASDKDCWGRAAGDVSRWEYGVRFDKVPITHRVEKKFFDFLQERSGTGYFVRTEFTHEREPQTFGTHYSVEGFASRWHECPFKDKAAADEFIKALNTCTVEFVKVPVEWSKGKARELDAARSAAVWPDATDEDLTAPGLKDRLEARLPQLLADFRAAVETLGFTY